MTTGAQTRERLFLLVPPRPPSIRRRGYTTDHNGRTPLPSYHSTLLAVSLYTLRPPGVRHVRGAQGGTGGRKKPGRPPPSHHPISEMPEYPALFRGRLRCGQPPPLTSIPFTRPPSAAVLYSGYGKAFFPAGTVGTLPNGESAPVIRRFAGGGRRGGGER